MKKNKIKAEALYNTQVRWDDKFSWEHLTDAYRNLYESWGGETKEHCDLYEALTLEDKILIDEDMKYLKEHSDCLNLSMTKLAIEECLIKLRRRERRRERNDKRN